MCTSITILIVDDDHSTAEMLSIPLKGNGYDVVAASNSKNKYSSLTIPKNNEI